MWKLIEEQNRKLCSFPNFFATPLRLQIFPPFLLKNFLWYYFGLWYKPPSFCAKFSICSDEMEWVFYKENLELVYNQDPLCSLRMSHYSHFGFSLPYTTV